MSTAPNTATSSTSPTDTEKPEANAQPSIIDEIATLRELTAADLVERYTELHGKPPRSKHREWLWRRVAWKLQEQRFGGLSQVAKRRLDELIGELDLPLTGDRTVRGRVEGTRTAGKPIVGTVLIRQWRGMEVRATRVEAGWECDGVVHRSLSALVKAVTGTHASGPAWFGLKTRGARR